MAENKKSPITLNSLFTICSYDGGSQSNEEAYEVKNILKKGSNPHCSGKGTNFNLVLEANTEFTLTNFVITQPANCTCPIASGAIWISTEKPEVEKYTKEYDSFDLPETSQSLPKPTDPTVFFKVASPELQIALKPWKSGKYLHIKFISPNNLYNEPDCNIDVGFLGLVGFVKSEAPAEYDLPLIPEELGITKPTLKDFNPLVRDFANHLNSSPAALLLLGDTDEQKAKTLKESVKSIASARKFKDLIFFYGDAECDLLVPVKGLIGINDSEPAFVIMQVAEKKKYVLPRTTEITCESVEKFCADFKAGTLPPFVKSTPRPANDRHNEHPELFMVTANTFNELVLDDTKDVFLDVYADWCGPCVAVGPTIVQLAKVLNHVETLRICKLDCDENDTDPEYLPETSIPNMKLFPAGNKKNSVKYSADRTLQSFIKFVHDNAKVKFDLDKALEKANVIQEEIKKEEEARQLSALKNVKKMHSDAEYEETLKKAKEDNKLVVIDFTASWCGPCKKIAPIFAQFSVDFPNVLFLKVDVDELAKSAEEAGVTCMPTFHLIKGGKTLDKLEGANSEQLKTFIVKHAS